MSVRPRVSSRAVWALPALPFAVVTMVPVPAQRELVSARDSPPEEQDVTPGQKRQAVGSASPALTPQEE